MIQTIVAILPICVRYGMPSGLERDVNVYKRRRRSMSLRSVEKRGCEMKSARFRPEFRVDTREES